MLNFIENFQSNDSLELPKGYYNNKTDSVFVELLKQNEDILSKAQYMDLFYFFDRLERFVSLLMNERPNTANCYFDKFNPSNFKYPVSFDPYVQSLYSYAKAYKYYSEGKLKIAYETILNAFYIISPRENESIFFVLSKVDLIVRAYPILIKNETKDQIIERISSIIIYFFIGKKYSKVNINMDVINLPEEKKRTWLFYILENVIYYSNIEFNENENELREFYSNMFTAIIQNIPSVSEANIDIYNGLKIVAEIKSVEDSEIDEIMNEHFFSIKKCPRLLKQLLLRYYIDYLKNAAIDSSVHKNYPYFLESIKPYQVAAT